MSDHGDLLKKNELYDIQLQGVYRCFGRFSEILSFT